MVLDIAIAGGLRSNAMGTIAIIVAAAAGFSVPSIAGSIRLNDYPNWALAEGASAASTLRLNIDPTGRITKCSNLNEAGDSRLARDLCRIISKKRLQAPTLRDGQKVHAFLDTTIKLFLPDTVEGRRIRDLIDPPDVELTVSGLAGNTSAEVAILLAYDATGKITDCAPAGDEENVQLTTAACQQRALFDNVIQRDADGRPVAYVTRKGIRFVASPKPE
jgi:hypothetical protein